MRFEEVIEFLSVEKIPKKSVTAYVEGKLAEKD